MFVLQTLLSLLAPLQQNFLLFYNQKKLTEDKHTDAVSVTAWKIHIYTTALSGKTFVETMVCLWETLLKTEQKKAVGNFS